MPTHIAADGTEREVDGRLTLEAMQALVGGYIEHVRLPDGRHLFLDEDGKLKNKPVNVRATELFYPEHDQIVGDVLVLTEAECRAVDQQYRVRPFPEAQR